jgi:hypothetical protein
MDPCVQASGQTLYNGKRYVNRKLVVVITATTNTLDVTPASLGVPDGAKILSLKVYSIDTRSITVTVPNDSIMVVNNGSTTAPFGGIVRNVAAPLSRFPVVKVNIPDLLAAPLDNAGTGKLFTVSTIGSTTPTFRIAFTAKYLA